MNVKRLSWTENNLPYIISVDVGTTNIRCHIYDQNANVKGSAFEKIQLVNPHPGWVEIEPEQMWTAFVLVVKRALQDAKLPANQISCIAIATQRGTFTTWDRESGENFHNFIVWNDNRSEKLCNEWNKSIQMTLLRTGASVLYFLTRKKRFLAASILKFNTALAVMKLVWVLENVPKIRQRALEGCSLFGTVDTWLLWKLTGGLVHSTEPSNACVTGIFDPYEMSWANWAINIFNLPPSLFPDVQNTCGEFGRTITSIFGASIPITAMVGDQQASTFGECCFELGDVKCTLGTGSFIQINTGNAPHASMKGIYPVVGWQINGEVTYLAEGKSHDNGTVINWAQSIGLFDDPSVTCNIAKSVIDSGGVFFVPAFAGIQIPINDSQATSAFVGLTPQTTKAHMIRAILEALSFRVLQMFETMQQEADFSLKSFRLDGGVSENDFVAQLISDLTGRTVIRPKYKEMSSLGAAFLGGLAVGIWKDKTELLELKIEDQVFLPSDSWNKQYRQIVHTWERAVARCLHWYPKDSRTI